MTALPAEMIKEVLCRLPVKYLLRFRCVSKGWCFLIDSNVFAKKQLMQLAEDELLPQNSSIDKQKKNEKKKRSFPDDDDEEEGAFQLAQELNKIKLRVEELESRLNEVRPSNKNKVRFADRDEEVETITGDRYVPCQIFVGGLPRTLTREQFKKCFEQFGDVSEAKISTHCDTGFSRGFGFITFYSQEDVEKVLNTGEYYKLGDATVQVKRSLPKPHSPHGRNQDNCTSSAYATIGGMSGHTFPQPQHPFGYPPFQLCQPSYYYPSYYYPGTVYSNYSCPIQSVQGWQTQQFSRYGPPNYYHGASNSNAGYQGSGGSGAYPGNQPNLFGG